MGTEKIIAVLIGFLCIVCLTSGKQTEYEKQKVRMVHQHFHDKMNNKLVEITQHYFNFELANKAYAAFYGRADIALPGFSKFFKKNGLRMREIGLNLTRYINKRGGFFLYGPVELNEVCDSIEKAKEEPKWPASKWSNKICRYQDAYSQQKGKEKKKLKLATDIGEWQHGLLGLEDALTIEKLLVDTAIAAINVAKEEMSRDVNSKHFLEMHCYNVEQVKATADLVTKLKSYGDEDYKVGEYLMDQELNS